MTARPLYAIGDDLAAIVEELVDAGGELTPDLEARLAHLEGEFEQKVERVGLMIQNLQSRGDVAGKQADRLTALARADHHAAKRLKGYLQACLEQADRRTVRTPLIHAYLQRNPPSIAWDGPPETIPSLFQRIIYELDGQAAQREWKAKGALPQGFTVTVGTHLRLK